MQFQTLPAKTRNSKGRFSSKEVIENEISTEIPEKINEVEIENKIHSPTKKYLFFNFT